MRGMKAVAVAAVAIVVVGLFGDALVGDRVFAFRDSIHTFPALGELIREEWLRGSVPLWNPLLNGGQPLAAMNVPAAFYPPQLLALLVMPTGLALTTLALAHLAIGAAGSYAVARDEGLTPAAATIAGLAYACGGVVAFQVYHPNTVIGAGWFPWSVWAGLRLARRWSPNDFLVLAVSLAMAVLGGDPQAAYNAGIVLAILIACRVRDESGVRAGRLAAALGRLAIAACLAAALSWVQIALTREFMSETSRYADAFPVSVWDIPRFLREADPADRVHWADVILGRPPPAAGFYHQIYDFSVAPWRILDLVSPTLAGPLTDRWTVARRLEGSGSWVATLYSGIVPLACVCLAVGRRRRADSLGGWGVVLGVAFLAAVGGFGLVAVVRHAVEVATTGAMPAPYRPGDEVGGLSWMMATLLPGYAGFRSPGKWLTPAALAFAQLAARGFDRAAVADGPRDLRRIIMPIAIAAAVVTSAAVAAAPATVRVFVLTGGLLAGAACVAAWVALRMREAGRLTDRSLAAALVLITAADLVASGRTFVASAALDAVREGSGYLGALVGMRLPACAAAGGRPRLMAVDGAITIPSRETAAERARLVGLVMRCNTPLLHGWGKFGEPGTAMQADVELLTSPLETRAGGVFPRRTFDMAAVEFFVVPAAPSAALPLAELHRDWSPAQKSGEIVGLVPQGPEMPSATPPPPAGARPLVAVIRNDSALPRVRIVRDVRAVAPVPNRPRRRWSAFLADLAFPSPQGPRPDTTAVVETSDVAALADLRPGGDTTIEDSCRITVDEPRRVVVEADLAAAGLVVLADAFHPDWTATVSLDGGGPRPLGILRVNRIQRGCLLPAGRHVVEFRHRSATFRRAVPITLAGWVVAAAVVAWAWRRPRGL